MDPAAPYSAGLTFGPEVLGEPQDWVVHHRGLEYRGEVIVAESLDTAWGRPLDLDLDFRVVLFTVPRRIPSRHIQDRRIAMAVPGRAPDQVESLGRELRAIRETKERYVTARDTETIAVRGSLEDRVVSVQRELARRYAAAYSTGAELAFAALDRAMRAYNRRLGSHSARRILDHPTKEQLDQFVALVQVADPSVLANVLDDEVVAFLRRFLSARP